MSYIVAEDIFYIVVLVGLSIPLGIYMYKVMTGQKVFLTRAFAPVENGLYKIMGVRSDEEMGAKKYTLSVLWFSLFGLVFLFLLQMLQGHLPFNPQGMKGTSWDLAFNTAASFLTNTNWQAYSGESTMSYLTQFLGLTVQNFLSAAVGIAVLFALIRGFVLKRKNTLGSFWVDLTRTTLYVLIPISFIAAIFLVSQGAIQALGSYKTVAALQGGAAQILPMGPVASQEAIKELGTNGGGFFGANSAHPFENPTSFSNIVETLLMFLIPGALCVTFGKAVKDMKQGKTMYITMVILFAAALVSVTAFELFTAPAFQGVAASGNMEGKEIIHGVGGSALWSAVATGTSTGAVNSMFDSFTPLGGMIPILLMGLGELVFGGVGTGLITMLAFVLMTVFIAGLMVGRTPEYLGKKVEPFDMKMVCLIILVPVLSMLICTAGAVLFPATASWLTNSGAHSFSEVLYTFVSQGANNGSAFGGYSSNNVFTNVLGGIEMLVVRYIPMVAAIYLGGNLAQKKKVAVSVGTLSTTNGMFIGLLIGIVLIIGALNLFPALALGPIADFLTAAH